MNPAVTIALAVGRRFSWREVPDHLVAQLVGGFLAVAALCRRAAEPGRSTFRSRRVRHASAIRAFGAGR
ncbi:aquaporin [Streptosporangium subroseum]|uniref:aquaporin n=1 Tax=Streptosporangium subroseum TaxID=106412 RepID=UPI000B793515